MCRKGLARHFDADDVFLVTKQGLDFFHDHFDYPYPFGKYDQAFVPEYNLGAMENPGLVTFREEFIFRGKVTQASYERRANVILHEMAHMWFGDLVTMVWWDDLWLKESFADFMGTFSMVEATRFTNGWITFANNRKSWAYRADQLPSTHPITADIRDLEDAKLNFDGITYAKGASVLKQLVAYVGRDAFLEGARRYFKRHAYGNTRLGDLLSVLEETSGRDMAAWSRSWLQTAGVNSLTPQVILSAEGRVTELAVLQEAAESHPELRPHRVAVGLYRRSPRRRGGAVRACRGRRRGSAHGRRRNWPGTEAPDLVLVNDDDLTYCKIRFDEGSLDALRDGLGDITDPLARALCWSALWNLTRDALMPARDFIDLVLRFAGRETDIGVLQMLHAWANSALIHYAAPEWRERGRTAARRGRAARAAARRARQPAPADVGAVLRGGRVRRGRSPAAPGPAGGHGEDRRALRSTRSCAGRSSSRWPRTGSPTRRVIAAELARDDTASGKRHQVRCLAARPSAAVKAQAWASVVESDSLSNALVEATIAGFAQPSQRELLAPYAPKYFEVIERVWEERSIQIGMDVVRGLFPSLQDSQATLDATDAWLAAHAAAAPALRRLVLEARDDLARALRGQACDAAVPSAT